MQRIAKEPVLTWGTIAAIFNALQLIAIPGAPIWVHVAIVIIATVAAAIAARQHTVATSDKEGVASIAKDLGLLKDIEEVTKNV